MANEDLVGDTAGDLVSILDQELPGRREDFVRHYLVNGRNATRAAIAAGYSEKSATAIGCEILTFPNVQRRIATLTTRGLTNRISLDSMLNQLSAMATFDRRKLYDAEGQRIPVHLLDDETAMAISHIGPNGVVPYDKTKAVDMALKHLGAYERDNTQRASNIQVNIQLVGGD